VTQLFTLGTPFDNVDYNKLSASGLTTTTTVDTSYSRENNPIIREKDCTSKKIMDHVTDDSINLEQQPFPDINHDTPTAQPANDDEKVCFDDLLPIATDLLHNMEDASPRVDSSFTLESPVVIEANVVDKVEEGEDVLVEQPLVKNDSVTSEPPVAEIWEPAENDVLTGRGACINLHPGNQKFRALCYANKAVFDVANHAAKKRIVTEIWTTCQQMYSSRFLSKRNDKGPWTQQSSQQAILKVAQTIRDYQRPDRIIQRKLQITPHETDHHNHTGSNNNDTGNQRRRSTTPATPMGNVVIVPIPQQPIVENPDGVETNDVLCGRGAVCLLLFIPAIVVQYYNSCF
jgi:hypothetical protein